MYRQYRYKLNNKINTFFSEPFDCGHSLGTGYYKNKKYFLLVSKNASTNVRTILAEKNWSYHNNKFEICYYDFRNDGWKQIRTFL